MKIKTIVKGHADDFDDAVNAALDEGYRLIRRDVINDHHYAQLEKADEPVQLNLMDAVRTVHEECLKYDSCRDCPLDNVCNNSSPAEWIYSDED